MLCVKGSQASRHEWGLRVKVKFDNFRSGEHRAEADGGLAGSLRNIDIDIVGGLTSQWAKWPKEKCRKHERERTIRGRGRCFSFFGGHVSLAGFSH